MKKTLATVGIATLLISLPASAVELFAGWDTFTAEPNEADSAPTFLGPDTAATMSGTATGGSWSDWNNSFFGASTDGTFGSLSSTIASASTNSGAGTSSGNNVNLSLNRNVKPGTLTFTLINNSGSDRSLEGFYFDGAHRFSQSAPTWELTFGGVISGTSASDNLAEGNMMGLTAAQRDWAVDLTGLADNIWDAGGSAVFTLTFSGGDPSTGPGGGQETLIDNIGITATVIPEPSALALLGLGGFSLILRRRF
jgi:hypothetical protein